MHDEPNRVFDFPALREADDSPARVRGPSASQPRAVVDAEALKIAKASLVGACEYFPWAGPLLESIAIGATPGVIFATCWGGTSTGTEPLRDPEKHAAYVAHMERTILEASPWLLPLLNAAGATVIAGPGVFTFMVPHRYGTAHDIPQLQQLTHLLPWIVAGEEMH